MSRIGSPLRNGARTAFRASVVASAVLLLLWIVVAELVAVVRTPYLIAAYWFLGVVGLVTCAAACLSALPGSQEADQTLHPLRSLGFLSVAASVGLIFWIQGNPVFDADGSGMILLGVILAVGVLAGIAVLSVLSALAGLVAAGAGDRRAEPSAPGIDSATGASAA